MATYTYRVQADMEQYTETFTSYQDAYSWLILVRMTLGCNASLLTLRNSPK